LNILFGTDLEYEEHEFSMYLQCLRQRRDVTTRLPLSENVNITHKFELLWVLNTELLNILFGTDLEYEEHEFNMYLQCLRQRREVNTRLPFSKNGYITHKFELLRF
jgi:hypothetical protein